jgi:hypothetical protein
MNQIMYIESVIKEQLGQPGWQWLAEKGAIVHSQKNASTLNEVFSFISRKTGNEKLKSDAAVPEIENAVLDIRGWTIDRLCRVWLIMQLDPSDRISYLSKIESLFSGASMNELVALYSALPVLAYPEAWRARCAEGIRSNIGTVLEAIMYENAYPFHWLDEAAFNQMVLKAFFADKDVDRIVGMDQRANEELAGILFDYAHERWAAGRTVNPQLWRLTGKYIHALNFPDILRLWNTGSSVEKKAALLACSQSDFPPARKLWENERSKKEEFNWHNLHG